ncbi:MAG: hypothetical protein Kow0059_13850 [Candidatus Sumerlaeia bacterium]
MKNLIGIALCALAAAVAVNAWGAFYIESRKADGSLTDASLYEESGGWYVPGSTAKSRAPAPELPGGVLQGQGSRFSDNTQIDAAATFRISAHPQFVPGRLYSLFITTPDAPSVDAGHSTFVLFDDAHPESAPLAAGVVPLTHADSGDVWLEIAGRIELGAGAALKIAEAAPQGNRFYADAIRIVPFLGEADPALGRRANLTDASRWERWAFSLSAPSPGATVAAGGGALAFTVPEAGRQMRWRHSMRPVWLDVHPYLTITCRGAGIEDALSTPIVRLCTQSDSWITAFTTRDVAADGARHTLTLDLRTKSSAAQIIGVEILVPARQTQGAWLEFEEFRFSDSPPGYQFPPPTPSGPATMGFDLDRASAGAWQPKPGWLSPDDVSADYSVQSTGSSLVFAVNDSNRAMKWLNVSIGPQDTSVYSFLVLHYRCRNLRPSSSSYAIWLEGGGLESRPVFLDELIDDGRWHWAVVPNDIPAVSQMAVQVQSTASGQAMLEIGDLAFADAEPRTDLSYFTPLVEGWDGVTSTPGRFKPVDLGELVNASAGQLLPRMGIGVAWFEQPRVSIDARVPFQLAGGPINLVCTSIPGKEQIVVPEDSSASEVYLLMGAYLPARENPSSDQMIRQVDETERFVVEVEYADGGSEQFFPIEISSRRHLIFNQTFSGYAVPADPGRTIRAVRLLDRSDGGLFALAALTLNTSGDALYADCFGISEPVASAEASPPAPRPPAIISSPPQLIVENSYFRYVFDLSAGVRLSEWTSLFTNHNLLAAAPDGRLFSGHIDGATFTSLDFSPGVVTVLAGDRASTAVIPLRLRDYEDRIDAVLRIHIDESPEAEFSIQVDNIGSAVRMLDVTFPDLQGVTLGANPDDLFYAYPGRTFVNGSSPISMSEPYSGRFPMQFMSLYNPPAGWGVSLVVRDLTLAAKTFSLSKSAAGASMGVVYPAPPPTGLRPGARLETAPFALGVHAGDWHAAFEFYRNWVRTWYRPRSPRQRWFQEIYTCRRDYPVGGTWYLFDRPTNRYTFEREMDNAARWLGGADMIDVSSWGWSAEYGRVGEYRRYELGGLENLREGIALSQSQGVAVGLYIEGYALDERCTIYQQHGEEWKVIREDGSDRRNGTEVIICTYPAAWQEYMKRLYAGVAAETGAAAMYIDVFGDGAIFPCFSGGHGHDPGAQQLRGELQMTRAIREGLNGVRPGIPLYTEYTPVDVTSQYQDGSFSYTIWYGDPAVSPTMTNLFRFAFPDFKQIELVNGLFLARNWTEEGLKKAFMNGEGIWVKGDVPAWYDPNTVAFYIKSHEIFRDHRDAFTTAAPEAFVPVRVGNVWAHRFGAGDKQLLTFYNGNWRNVSGRLVDIGSVQNAHVVDLWAEKMLDTVAGAADHYMITAGLGPRDIGCVAVIPRHMDVTCTGGVLHIRPLPPAASADIVLTGVFPDRRDTRAVASVGGADTDIVLSEIFDPMPQKVIVKLVRGGIVMDEIIVTDFDQWPPSGLDRWVCF